jgi:acyl-CoA synthetase (AMP-forming)/AMP-acid ligase II
VWWAKTARNARGKSMTFASVIRERAESDKTWLILPSDPLRGNDARCISYRHICEEAERFASGLLALGLHNHNAPVILIFDNDETFCAAFLGCVIAGAIPITRSPPWLYPRFAAELGCIIEQSGACLVVTDDAHGAFISSVCGEATPCVTLGDVMGRTRSTVTRPTRSASPLDTPLLIQYSSGSTRDPLGVALPETAVLHNIQSIGAVLGASANDVFVSWLPVAHDMGLIASVLYSFYWEMSLVFMSPLTFLSKPARWLWAISRFGGTVSAAPNFAFSLCASPKRVPDEMLSGLNLSTWRSAVSGAEAVQLDTVHQFTKRMQPHGLRAEAMCPAYGLAENSVACTIVAPAVQANAELLGRDSLELDGLAVSAKPGSTDRTLAIMSTGRPIPGTEVRIVDESGNEVLDRRIGEIEFRGTSTMMGYWQNPTASSAVRKEGGWIRSGDLGFGIAGELYIVGRSKQIIKRAGRCFDAAEMAQIAGSVVGVRRGCVSVLSVPDAHLGSERLIVLAEASDDSRSFEDTTTQISLAIVEVFGLRPDEVLLLRSGSLPKSSSGKIQLAQCMKLYSGGAPTDGLIFSSLRPSENDLLAAKEI